MKTIYECVYGSKAYGLDVPGSDTDIRGVYVYDIPTYLGCNSYKESIEYGKDKIHYELKRFLSLCLNSNPTIIEMLFVDWGDVIISSVDGIGTDLWWHRSKLLSKKIANSFVGVSKSMEKKSTPKSIMHMIRTLRMAKEILQTGEVNVKRKDREELLAIRNQQIPWHEIESMRDSLLAEIKSAEANSRLPENLDRNFWSKICYEIIMGLSPCYDHDCGYGYM